MKIAAGNRKLSKKRSSGRIDGAIALARRSARRLDGQGGHRGRHDATAVQRLAKSIYAERGAPELLFNAGRFVSMAPIWDSDLADWWEDVRVNILSVYTVTRAILPLMLRRDRGVIINMGGGRPGGGSGYAASKAGAAEFTRALSNELRQAGSHVSTFLADPGLVDTDMTRLHAKNPVTAQWVPELVDRAELGHRVEIGVAPTARIEAPNLNQLMPALLQISTLLGQVARLDGHVVEAGSSRLKDVAPRALF